MESVVDKYEVSTDTRGHLFFLISNYFGKQITDEINIESGEARSLKASANDFLRRSGGYDNPAADSDADEESDGAV